MKPSIPYLLLGLALLPAAPTFAGGPGFDCAKATRQIDKVICAWETVAVVDGEMAGVYKAALAAQPDEAAIASVRSGQKAWLAERDRRCGLENVTPQEGSEDGLSPKEFGQLVCLQAIYPPRIAQLKDIIAPPLVPLDIKTVPIAPLKSTYPEAWQHAGYQALFSPDKTLMALGIEDNADYVMQVWLYQPASGRLVLASPRTHQGAPEAPEDITELNAWMFGKDGRFYLRARRPRGDNGWFGADMNGYAEVPNPPADVVERVAANDAARNAAFYKGEIPEREWPPGFDDDSYDEQQGGAFTAWAQNRGHGSFDLLAARHGDKAPQTIVSGGWELRDFRFDPSGTRLFYNGEDGLVVTDPDSHANRRLKGTRGIASETKPITLSADGRILVYSTNGLCTRDAADDPAPDDDEYDYATRVCLAYLPPVSDVSPRGAPADDTLATSDAASDDPWVGKWSDNNAGALSAVIRRGTAKPEYLVIDLLVGIEGCSGAVTLYGKPDGAAVLGESYDPTNSGIPVCRVELTLDNNRLKTEVTGPCTYYHGASCGFDGRMTRVIPRKSGAFRSRIFSLRSSAK